MPNDWDVLPLEKLALVERGKFSARPRNDPKYYGGEIPFVQTGDISSTGTYLQNFSQTLNEEGLKVSKLFSKNTILITIAANIGDTAITTFDVACPDSVVAIQPFSNMANTYWLNKVLETRKHELDSQATQNAQKNINLQVLKPLLIKTPPLPEQKKIAKILSTWDKAITTTEQLLANSKQQKKALMQQLLTGKKRLPGFSGEWKEEEIKNITTLLKDGTHSTHQRYEQGIPMLSAVNITKSHKLNFEDAPLISEEDFKKIHSKYQIQMGDLLLTVVGTLGRTAIVNTTRQFTLQRSVAILRFKDKYCTSFVKQIFSSLFFQKLLQRKSNSTAQAGVYLGTLSKIRLSLPPLPEQQKIASILSTADKEIETLQQKLDCLKQEKKALMQQLLTGKRRVNVDELKVA